MSGYYLYSSSEHIIPLTMSGYYLYSSSEHIIPLTMSGYYLYSSSEHIIPLTMSLSKGRSIVLISSGNKPSGWCPFPHAA
jgi:uncharacterized membrane protein